MKEFVAVVSVIVGAFSTWYMFWLLLGANGTSATRRQFSSIFSGALSAWGIAWLVWPSEQSQGLHGGWVSLALIIAICLFSMARGAAQTLADGSGHASSWGGGQSSKLKPSGGIGRGSVGEVSFTYEDAYGEITHRIVEVRTVTGVYIKGNCLDRQEARTFRIDRILGDVVDCDTGEILKPLEYVRRFTR